MDSDYTKNLNTQIATEYILQGKYEEAAEIMQHLTVDQNKIFDAILENDSEQAIRWVSRALFPEFVRTTLMKAAKLGNCAAAREWCAHASTVDVYVCLAVAIYYGQNEFARVLAGLREPMGFSKEIGKVLQLVSRNKIEALPSGGLASILEEPNKWPFVYSDTGDLLGIASPKQINKYIRLFEGAGGSGCSCSECSSS